MLSSDHDYTHSDYSQRLQSITFGNKKYMTGDHVLADVKSYTSDHLNDYTVQIADHVCNEPTSGGFYDSNQLDKQTVSDSIASHDSDQYNLLYESQRKDDSQSIDFDWEDKRMTGRYDNSTDQFDMVKSDCNEVQQSHKQTSTQTIPCSYPL